MNKKEKEAAIEKLNARLAADTSLPLKASATHDVPGEGNPSSTILFVGEAPGAKEDATGRPFVGSAGKLLDDLIASIGLKREDIFIANLIKHRPPSNRDPMPEEIAAYTPYLDEQIDIIQPKVIVTLGRFSMRYFLGETRTISNIHGQPKRNQKGQIIIPMYHPAAALYSGNLRPILFSDFAKIPKVIKIIETGSAGTKKETAELTPTETEQALP